MKIYYYFLCVFMNLGRAPAKGQWDFRRFRALLFIIMLQVWFLVILGSWFMVLSSNNYFFHLEKSIYIIIPILLAILNHYLIGPAFDGIKMQFDDLTDDEKFRWYFAVTTFSILIFVIMLYSANLAKNTISQVGE